MIDRFGLIGRVALGELGVLCFLRIFVKVSNCFRVACRDNIMGTEVQRTEYVDRNFAVETEASEADRRDFLARFVKGSNLENIARDERAFDTRYGFSPADLPGPEGGRYRFSKPPTREQKVMNSRESGT